jgi:DNA-binding SARP family transcriptional activator
MAELELKLLGRFQARCSSGRPVELTTRKTRALLAYLALYAGQAQSRDKLTPCCGATARKSRAGTRCARR